MIYWTFYYIFKAFSKILFPFTAIGKENIPLKGNYIFACNHLSYLDPILVGLCVNRRISYIARDSLFRNKVFGWFLKKVGVFPIKRGSSDIRSLREAIKRLKTQTPLLVFPEGTRFSTSRTKKTHPGIGFLAKKTGLPVIPVRVDGSDKVLPSGAKWFKKHYLKISFGEPVIPNKYNDYSEIASKVMESIESL